ncbi:Predicted O-linked N-acetylglucosamine transferase, SPINDLY family [Reichenbachiella faecimaris]|uniref:protein O-GlcNAc transferase n=1 Tax=Reichenbachiella faecimaris TaxID=692418 RepID=A0A1W2GDH1_REIFA|nr:glycosyltransferase family 41 protein [Reichenbachiella faecimaris]SMD34641.1 Predicted O-linked N-acetylglucosamine transferase, SPINDLY family [Reichenbachiella faecimaris]
MISGKAYYDQLLQEATLAHQSGDLTKAISLYKQLTLDMSSQPEPYHRLALIHAQKGQYKEAIPWFEKAVDIHPNHPAYKTNFAETLQRLNQNERAIQLLRQALEIDKEFLEAQQKLGTILKKIGQYEEASTLFKSIIEKESKFYPAFFQLGTLMLETGNYKSAKKYLKSSVTLNSKSVKALNNLAIAHQEWDEFDEAIACHEKALAVDPQYVDSLQNLALIYEKTGHPDKAKALWLRQAHLKGADPLISWKAEILEPSIFQSTSEIDQFRKQVLDQLKWIKSKKINLDADQLTKLDIYPPAGLIYQGKNDLEIKKAYSELFSGIPKATLPTTPNTKPQVGFVVTGGHEGVFVKCMRGLINHLSTEKMDITIICSLPNGEKIVKPAIENPAIKFVSLPKSLGQCVHLLVSLNFDFLHYWEVGTDAYNYFIPYFKPARVQATSWGWPITSGIATMDYFISCKGLDEEVDQKAYSEKVILFDRLPSYYHSPEVPDLNGTRSDFGIDEKCHLYLCTQNVKKIHPDFDQITKGILAKDDKAFVVFLGDKHQVINDALNQRLNKNCAPYSDRIVVLDRQDKAGYFNLLNLADVILDTLYYNGGANTNADAFALNKPVVTMPVDFHRGRYTATAYKQMGFEDLIAYSIDDYVGLATKLTSDPSFYQMAVEKIASTKSQFFEDKQAVVELENFILSCFQNPKKELVETVESVLDKARIAGEKGDIKTSLELLDDCLKTHPKSALVWMQKGLYHKALQQWQPAFDSLNNARQLDGSQAEILKKFAELLCDLGKGKDAFIAYQKALKLNPEDPETLNNFGGLLIENRQFEDAIPLLKKSIEIDPNQRSAFINLGMAYEQVSNIKSAISTYSSIVNKMPADDLFKLHIETLCPTIVASKDEIESYQSHAIKTLNTFESLIPDTLSPNELIKGSAFPSFNLTYHGYNIKEIHSSWGAFYAKRIKPISLGPKNPKPKIGFLVTHGHEGVFIKGGCGLIKQLSSDQLDIVVLMNGEEARQKIKNFIDRTDITYQPFSKNLEQAVKEIATLNLDFLYYWEVGSDVLNYFLPFYQLGKIQMLSWGSPFTSGNPRIQYYLASKWVESQNYADHYTEGVVLFDPLVYYYYPIQKPTISKTRTDFGLPADKKLYLCIQAASKIHPDMDLMLKGILEKDDQAVIALSMPEHEAILKGLRQRFERTIGPKANRILFVPKVSLEDYPQRIALADVCLDTPHYAGFNTTYETLQMGTPVVTLPGEFQRGKYTEAIYRMTGLDRYIPKSEDEYVDMAVRLANDSAYREKLIQKFNSNSYHLFEQREIVDQIESFLLNAFSSILR